MTFALKLIPTDMFDMMLVRFFVQTIIFGSYAGFYKRYSIFNTNGQPFACAMNTIMSSGTNLTYLAAFYFLPLSDLNTIKYSYIVWAAILSVIFLKDRFKSTNLLSLILTIIGIVLATKSNMFLNLINGLNSTNVESTNQTNTSEILGTLHHTSPENPLYYLGIIFGLISSLTKAIQMIARKHLVSSKQPHSVMNFQFTFVALFTTIIYSLIRRYWQPEPYPWGWMCTAGVLIGCVQTVTNTFYIKGLKRENVQFVSILGTLDILHGVALQYIFFRQTKNWIFFVGASLVVISAILLTVDNHRAKKKSKT